MAASVVSDSLRPHGLWPARLFCPWDSQVRILQWKSLPSSGRGEDKFRLRRRRHWEKSGRVLWTYQCYLPRCAKSRRAGKTSPSSDASWLAGPRPMLEQKDLLDLPWASSHL